MKLFRPLATRPTGAFHVPRPPSIPLKSSRFTSHGNWVSISRPSYWKLPNKTVSTSAIVRSSSSPVYATSSRVLRDPHANSNDLEESIEKAIYRCRFMALFGVMGSLVGSFLCFIKGCSFVVQSFTEYFVKPSKVIVLLVEAIDVYLLGTVMMVFGMGLYELFVSNLDIAKSLSKEKNAKTSNLFGLFTLKERPRWLDIKSVNELKTKLGHVIVMLLLIGLFDKSKKAAIHSPVDLLCFSASVLLSSGCLYLLSKLNGPT